DPQDKDALAFWDTSEWETRFGKMFVAFNVFFAIVGSFTLLVGGIGVANIMYIVVRERTREIGVRRAVGATRADIMRQFFAGARRHRIPWKRCAPEHVLHPAPGVHRRPEGAAHPGLPHLLCGDLGNARGRVAARVW